MILIIMNW